MSVKISSITQVVISTLPALAGFTLPKHLLETATPPVIFDVVYKPAMTKLIAQVQNKQQA